MKLFRLIVVTFLLCLLGQFKTFSQIVSDEDIEMMEDSLLLLHDQIFEIEGRLESKKLRRIIRDIKSVGWPECGDCSDPVEHQAMVLSYNEKHEQANWVMHIITPDILGGKVGRTNDFRGDPLITSGTAVTEDYWDSGFDRGHLAPSADFQWSKTALSESYFYSNMSPQRPELNREVWAELENLIREYVVAHKRQLYVITGGMLNEGLPSIGKSKVSIPEYYYKVVLDLNGDSSLGIGFMIPNKQSSYPPINYALAIDEIEKSTGMNFFPNLKENQEKRAESAVKIENWMVGTNAGESPPISPELLPKGKFNTVQAAYHMDDKLCVCGKVVSAKYSSKSGATFLNLDRKFPNHVFSISIWKDDRTHFSYAPEEWLFGKDICVTGTVKSSQGVPSMNISKESAIEMWKIGDK